MAHADSSAVVRHDVAVVELAVGQIEQRAPDFVWRDARLAQSHFWRTPGPIVVRPAGNTQVGESIMSLIDYSWSDRLDFDYES